MSQPSNDNVAKALLDPSRKEVSWPSIFAGVKNVVKANNLNNDTLTCIKGWLKSNDSQLHVPLLSLTVLHTMSLNCGHAVRNQLASPKLFLRLEKQLARPQGPQVATAIVQVLVDWSYMFHQEELGVRSRALLAQPRYSQMAAGSAPSPALMAMQEELRLGIPSVAPVRGEDFIRWMYRGASFDNPNLAVPITGCAVGGAAAPVTGSAGGAAVALAQGLPGGAPPAITTKAVPQLCGRMKTDALRLKAALGGCRTAARSQRLHEVTAAMDAAYREAERCSQWRMRVQEYTQHSDDPTDLSAILAATDVINQVLQEWQSFSGQEVYDTMHIVVPPPPPGMLSSRGPTRDPSSCGRGVVGGAGADTAGRAQLQVPVHDVFEPFRGLVQDSQPQPPPQPQARPIGVGDPGAAPGAPSVLSNNPFAGPPGVAATGPAMPGLSNWNPFASPQPLPRSPACSTTGGGGGGGGFPSAAAEHAASSAVRQACDNWAQFGEDPAGFPSSRSYSAASTGVSSPMTSGPAAVRSPTTSPTSLSSAPQAVAAAAAATPQPAATATATRPPATTAATSTSATTFTAGRTAAAAAGATAPSRPAAGLLSSSSQPDLANALGDLTGFHGPYGPGGVGPNGSGPTLHRISTAPSIDAFGSASGSGSAFARQAAVMGVAASVPPTPGSASGGGGGGAVAATATATAAAPLNWLPEYERLANDLRNLLTSSSFSGGASPPPPSQQQQQQPVLQGAAAAAPGGSGPGAALLSAVLPLVQGLCESLAAKHALQMASLEARLAAAGRQQQQQQQQHGGVNNGGGMANGAGWPASSHNGGGSSNGGGPSVASLTLQQQGPGLGSGVVMGTGAGAGTGQAPMGAAMRQSSLHQGRLNQGRLQQQQRETPGASAAPPFKLNAFEDLAIK